MVFIWYGDRYGLNEGIDHALLTILGCFIGSTIGVSLMLRNFSYEVSLNRILEHNNVKSRVWLELDASSPASRFRFLFNQPFYMRFMDVGFVYVLVPSTGRKYLLGPFTREEFNSIRSSYTDLAFEPPGASI
jgi:hypothetical protein